MNNLLSSSGLERSLNLAGIWPVNLQYLIPKTGALSTNKLFCGALFRCQDPCRRAPFRFCAFGSMGGNWEDEVFRHARHFHALSVARTAVHGNRNHHQLTHAASHLFLTCLYTCSGPDRPACGSVPSRHSAQLASSSFFPVAASRKAFDQLVKSTPLWPATALSQSAAWVGS